MDKKQIIAKINNIQEILNKAKKTLEETNISIYVVIAYVEKETNIDLRY